MTANGATSARFRTVLLFVLLAAEVTHLGLPVLPALQMDFDSWWWPFVWGGRPIVEAALAGLAMVVLMSWPVFLRELRANLAYVATPNRNRWLAAHLVCAGCFACWLWVGTRTGRLTPVEGGLWFVSGALVLTATLSTWCVALLPFSFWSAWFAHARWAFAAGATVGALARTVGYIAQMLWPALQSYTFVSVAVMLRMLGRRIIDDPSQSLIGTPDFTVSIAPSCSGLEGIGLIVIFMTIYLWVSRDELRFPQTLLLLPVGIMAVWLLNVFRITALILIGGSIARFAVLGFHSVAGWVFFNFTAIGLVIASRRTSLFAKNKLLAPISFSSNPAVPYLVPLIAIIATATITGGFFRGGLDLAYPLRVIVGGVVLWLYRKQCAGLLRVWTLPATMLGLLAVLPWVVFAQHSPSTPANSILANGLRHLPPSAESAWIVLRVIGAVITVPLAEELAFRGYLMRRISDFDFQSVAYSNVSLVSITLSSLAFGLLHQNLMSAMFAGIVYAIAATRKGRLGEAVCAHATSNMVLALFVIMTGDWALWT